MRKRSCFVKSVFCAAFCAALLAPAARGEDWKFSSSFNFDTGKYGGGDRIDSVYIPFTLKRYYTEGDIAVTVPYLRQSSTGQVTRVGGSPMRAVRGGGGVLTSSESGPGDILVRGTYIVQNEGPRSCDLSLAGTLKLPTANKNKGLGTGELDEGVGVEFAKKVSPGWTVLADGYYTIIGDTSGIDFNNQLSFDAGFSRRLREDLWLTALYATRSALLDGNADPRELSGTLDYRAADGKHYFCGLLLGLSDGSPETGFSAGFSLKF